jgi:hypothetical protein
MAERPDDRQIESDYSEMAEVFSDVFETHINPWSAALTFGLRAMKPEEKHVYPVRVRMPLQQAKALAVMLLRSIRGYEAQQGVTVELPAVILQSLNIPPEDWRRFSEDL